MREEKKYLPDFVGEFIGTFILVLIGCSAIAVTILFSINLNLLQIALIWGLGVTTAIYISKNFSDAHLNPAVSIAMIVGNKMQLKKLPIYLIAQFAGAFFAAAFLYLIFNNAISSFEQMHGIVRGSSDSMQTAMMFGEFYPNPNNASITVSAIAAFIAEALGTFTLVFMIFALTHLDNIRKSEISFTPVFIGLTVSAIIITIAPITQAGINPARDLAPRLFSMLAGWNKAALPDNNFGFLSVYVLAPILGGFFASIAFSKIVIPIVKIKIFKNKKLILKLRSLNVQSQINEN